MKRDFYKDLDREIERLISEFNEEGFDFGAELTDPDIPQITLCACGHHLVSPFEDAAAAHRRWEEKVLS